MLKKLYKEPYSFKLRVFSSNGNWWLVTLIDPVAGDRRPDCIVNHPTRKIGFRTAKGLEVEKYDSLADLVWDIKEEGKKYGFKFRKYKVVKNTAEEGRRIVKAGKIVKKVEVQEDNLDKIMRVICDSNTLDYPYEVRGFICGRIFKLESVLRKPVPLVSVLNRGRNFYVLKDIVSDNYSKLKEYDYKCRSYNYFNNSPPDSCVGGFLIPLRWFDYIEYSA